MPFVVALKRQRARAFHRWPDKALAEHLQALLRQPGRPA